MTRTLFALALLSSVVFGCSKAKTDDGEETAPLKACVESPDKLPRPPTGKLPCELIPPGLKLPAQTP
jgi:hypothetical protein